MKASFKGSVIACAVAAAMAAPAVQATNGYFMIGYGAKSRGMGGAGLAYGQDALASAANPAAIAMLGGNRIDAGIELFNPRRDARLNATAMGGGDSGVVESGATLFAVPNAGFVMSMGDGLTIGMSMIGAGGMNTRYNSNLYANGFSPAIGCNGQAFCGGGVSGFAGLLGAGAAVLQGLYSNPNAQSTSTLGVNLAQAILAPTVAMEVNDNHTVGASLLIGYQRFRAYGLGLFQGLSSDSANVTNQGDDQAWGAGVRLGWTGKMTDSLTVGAQVSSKVYMQEFDQYKGLFAEQGDFDIPANFGIGLSFKANDKMTVALDVQRILYSDVPSIANKGPTADQFYAALSSVLTTGSYSGAGQLGTDNGWGFGWDDITVAKLGVDYQYNKHWVFRGGLNVGGNPIDSDQNMFNILAPGVVKKHLTLGFTYSPSDFQEISVAYMHAMREDQSHTFQGSGGFAGFDYTAEIGMDQNALEVSYGLKF